MFPLRSRLIVLAALLATGLLAWTGQGSTNQAAKTTAVRLQTPVEAHLRTLDLPLASRWKHHVVRCDQRIVRDAEKIVRSSSLKAGDCYAIAGHARGSDHHLGLALDLLPVGWHQNWGKAIKAAELLGWDKGCNVSGCIGRLETVHSPMRFIAFSGGFIPRTGSIRWAPQLQLHLSWRHSLVALRKYPYAYKPPKWVAKVPASMIG